MIPNNKCVLIQHVCHGLCRRHVFCVIFSIFPCYGLFMFRYFSYLHVSILDFPLLLVSPALSAIMYFTCVGPIICPVPVFLTRMFHVLVASLSSSLVASVPAVFLLLTSSCGTSFFDSQFSPLSSLVCSCFS